MTPLSPSIGAAGRLFPGRRLAVRMGLALCLGAALILFTAALWNLHLQRAHLVRLVSLAADRIAEERAHLPKRHQLPHLWRFPYFLNSLYTIADTLREERRG